MPCMGLERHGDTIKRVRIAPALIALGLFAAFNRGAFVRGDRRLQENATVLRPPSTAVTCCSAYTASCMACASNVSVSAWCANLPSGSSVHGCPSLNPSPSPEPSPSPGGSTCRNDCVHASDGDCDDGGEGAEYNVCYEGSDCDDCGAFEAEPSPSPGGSTCRNDCVHAWDGDCDDGGEGAEYNVCHEGTDCEDCRDHPPLPSPPPPRRWPPLAPMIDGALWEIIHGGIHCQITNDGTCVTDGAGVHGANEECTIRAVEALYASATEFDLEMGYDYVEIGNIHYSGETGPHCASRSQLLTCLFTQHTHP